MYSSIRIVGIDDTYTVWRYSTVILIAHKVRCRNEARRQGSGEIAHDVIMLCTSSISQGSQQINSHHTLRTTPSLPYLSRTLPLFSHLSETCTQSTMSSDADYTSFLDKANQDTGAKASTKSTSASTSKKAVNTDIPDKLQKLDSYYTSEADEPFENVSLKWKGGELSAGIVSDG
jgi:hypothetical protein